VHVDLTSPAATAIGVEAQAMSAQFVWTLRQISGVSAVRITVAGVPLRGVPPVQDINAWPSWNPDAETVSANAFYADGKRVLSLDSDLATVVPGQVGDGTFPLQRPGVSFDERSVAGLDAGGHRLYVAQVGTNQKVPAAVITDATRLTAPSWDRFGVVWTADQRATGAVVWADSPGSAARKVTTQDLPEGQVLAMRIARDGARVVLIVQKEGQTTAGIYLGRVERGDSHLVLSGFRLISTQLTDATDVAWISADRLVVLGRLSAGSALEPLEVDLSGSSVRSLGPVPLSSAAESSPGIVSVTAEPGQEILASTSDGKLYRFLATGWLKVTTGQYPSYPG
jgi:hypothetical protein